MITFINIRRTQVNPYLTMLKRKDSQITNIISHATLKAVSCKNAESKNAKKKGQRMAIPLVLIL